MAVTAPDATKLPQIGLSNRLYLISGTKALPMESESSVGISNGLLEISNKDTGNWRTTIDGIKSVNLSASCDYAANNTDVQALIDSILSADSATEFTWGDIVTTGATALHGYARISQIDLGAPNGEVCTFVITLESTGEVEKVVK